MTRCSCHLCFFHSVLVYTELPTYGLYLDIVYSICFLRKYVFPIQTFGCTSFHFSEHQRHALVHGDPYFHMIIPFLVVFVKVHSVRNLANVLHMMVLYLKCYYLIFIIIWLSYRLPIDFRCGSLDFIFKWSYRNSTLRSCSLLKLRKRRSSKNTSEKRSRWKFGGKCKRLNFHFHHFYCFYWIVPSKFASRYWLLCNQYLASYMTKVSIGLSL